MHHSIAILPGGLGTGEILFIFAIVLLLFGPRKLPEIARSIGRTLDHLRKASQEFKDQVMEIEQDARQTIEAEATALMDGDDDEDAVSLSEELEDWDDNADVDVSNYYAYGGAAPEDTESDDTTKADDPKKDLEDDERDTQA